MTSIEKLYIDSRDRNPYEKENDFTINLSGDRVLVDTTSIYIDSMVFPNTQLPINETNNKLYCNMRIYWYGQNDVYDLQTIRGNMYFQAILSPGVYTTSDIVELLPQAIMDAFNNTYPASTPLVNLTCTFNTREQRFHINLPYDRYGGSTFAGVKVYFTIEDKKSDQFPNSFVDSLNYILGFDDNSAYHVSNINEGSAVALLRKSTEYVRLAGEQYIFLHCSAVSSSETSSKNDSNGDVLYKINLPIFGEIGYFNITGHNNSYISTNSKKISSLRFYITNSRDDLVDVDDYSFILGINY